MKLLTFTLVSLLSLNAIAQDSKKTFAASALISLKKNRESAARSLPDAVDQGADIAYACQSIQYKTWGNLVYNSIISTPDAIVPDELSQYLNAIDYINKSLEVIEGMRNGLLKTVIDTYSKFQHDNKFPTPVANLNFQNFKNEEKNYLESLNDCADSDFLDMAMAQLSTVDDQVKINGAVVVTPAQKVYFPYSPIGNTAGGIIAGGIMSNPGCGRECPPPQIILDVTDKSSIFNKTKTYENWINTFIKM